MKKNFVESFIALAGSLLIAAPSAAIVAQTEIIALTRTDGQLGPGLGPGVTFFGTFSARPPAISSNGTVAFLAAIDDGGISRGIWRAKPGQNPQPVAILGTDGQLGPGLGPNTIFSDMQDVPRVNDRGDVFFQAEKRLGNDANRDDGVWIAENNASPRPLAVTGDEGIYGPGLGPGFSYSEFQDDIVINSSSDVAWFGSVSGPGTNDGNNRGVWHSKSGGLPKLIARSGDTGALGPNLGPGVQFYQFGGPSIDQNGVVYMSANVFDNGAFRPTEWIVAKLRSSSPTEVFIRTATSGPLGLEAENLTFQPNGFGGRPNYAGQFALRANVAEFPQATWSVITREGPGSPRKLVARRGVEGPLGPQLGPGQTFSFFDSLVLGGGGHIGMIDQLQFMLDTEGVFLIPPGAPPIPYALTDTDGPLGPGLGTGVMFSFFQDDLPLINSRGDLVFRGVLFGDGVDQSNNVGLWTVADGTKMLLERTGALKNVDPTGGTDVRTITEINVLSGGGGQDGSPFALTDDRLLVYELTFADGSSGIFTTRLVPEPSAFVLAIFGCFLTCAPRQSFGAPRR
ncbi:MAG: choice-of-anchor tandem repeat NxxGxxAF-containing protein [Pirellulales bacterium]